MKHLPRLTKIAALVALALTAGMHSTVCFAEDPYDFPTLRAKWGARISSSGAPALVAGDPDVALQSNPPGANAGTGGTPPNYYTSMDTSAGRTSLWSDLPLTGTTVPTYESNLTASFSRLVGLINRYKTTTDAIYNNATAKSNILGGIKWLLDNHYKANGTAPAGWNWYVWQIGIPQQLNQLTNAWHPVLSDATTTINYTDSNGNVVTGTYTAALYASLDHFMPWVTCRATQNGGLMTMTVNGQQVCVAEDGANLSNKAVIALQRGIYGDNADKIQMAKDAVPSIVAGVSMAVDSTTLEPTGLADGFYPDYSFIQHRNTPYVGAYGTVLIGDLVKLYYMFDANSHWSIVNDPSYRKPGEWALNSYAPVIYDGAMFDSQRGRTASRQFTPDHLHGRQAIMSMVELSYVLPADQAAPLKAALKGWIQRDTFFGSSYYTPYFTNEAKSLWAGVSTSQIQLAKGIVNDSNITAADEPTGVRTYPIADRVVARGPGYAFNISMFSYNRISAAEAGNNENKKGWWSGMGATTLYDADHQQYGNHYWATVDKTRLSGTTTDHKMKSGTYADWQTWGNTKEVTGSVELNNQYGAAAMDFATLNVTGSTLAGKKAWFMFGDSIVAVGSGISGGDTTLGPVETVVENLALEDNTSNVLTVNDTSNVRLTANGTDTVTGATWAHRTGNKTATATTSSNVGYVFPDVVTLYGKRATLTDNWANINTSPNSGTTTNYSRNFLSLALNHNTSQNNAAYTYIVLPNKTATETKAFADANPIKVLERSTDAIAVEHIGLGVTGAVFWQRASKTVARNGFNLLSSDKPAIVTMQQTGNELELAVADPILIAATGQQRSKTINLEFHRAATGLVSKDPEVNVVRTSPTVQLAINTDRSDGKSIQAKFTLADVASNLAPAADAYVRDGTYAATNFGTASTLAVKSEVVGYNRNAFLKFDLSSINGRIASAKLRLVPVAIGSTPSMVHNMYLTSSSTWTEAGVNWSNKPANGNMVASWTVPSVANLPLDIDITATAVNALNGDKQLSLEIEASANYGSGGSVDYGSKNNANANYRPVLVIIAN
jgi:hyaluronate lyase